MPLFANCVLASLISCNLSIVYSIATFVILKDCITDCFTISCIASLFVLSCYVTTKLSGTCYASTASISMPSGYMSSISRCTSGAKSCVIFKLLLSSYKLDIGGNIIISIVLSPL
jgi:hypothetical protein